MKLIKEQLVETISYFVNLSLVDGIMLTGSHAEKRASASSDIDVILTSKLVNRTSSETVVHNHAKYQLLFFPYFKATSILLDDVLTGEGIYMSMLKKGTIIKDDPNHLLERLKTFAALQSTHISEHEVLNLRSIIIQNLEDLKVASTNEEKLFCAVDILKYTTQLLSGRAQSSGKHLGRTINTSTTALQQLVDAFNTFVQTKDNKCFSSTADLLLAQFGKDVKKHTTNYVWTVPPEQQIMVFFPSHTIYQKEVCESVINIIKRCDDCLCHSFYVGKNQFMEEGVYLAIYNKMKNGKSIFERIDEYRKISMERNIQKDIRMSFPYKTLYFEGLYLGGETLFKKLLPYYASISNFIIKTIAKKNTEHKRNILLLFATDFLLQFAKMFNVETDKHSFLNAYCESLLPEAVDPNALYNINQLSDIKEATLRYYESVFETNKLQLIKLSTMDNLTAIANYKSLQKLYCRISNAIADTSNEQFIFNPTWNTGEVEQILKTNIVNHVLSLFHLNSIEKFCITYNVAKLSA